jgi:outer membrane lipoprotein LolB
MKRMRRTCLGWISLSLVGCAALKTPPADASAYWTGRLALQVQSDPPQSLSAGFELQGSAEKGEMTLFSPIGTTLARLVWTPQLARLEQGHQGFESSDLQSLSEKLTGTALPVAALFEWLAGRPADVDGWHGDLSAQDQGRITARRFSPAPEAVLRILLDR